MSLRAFSLRTLLLVGLGLAFALAALLLALTADAFSSRARRADRQREQARVTAVLVEADAPQELVATVSRAVVEAPTDTGTFLRALSLAFLLTTLVVLVFTYAALTYSLVRPLENVTHAAERIARGSEDVLVLSEGARETNRLGAAVSAMASRLRADKRVLEDRLRALEQKTRELTAAQESLVRSEKLASVGRLGAGIAHEIGNPLAAIVGLLELLREGGLEAEEQAQFLERAHKETERIQRILRDLLDFARQGTLDESDLAQPVDVAGVVEHVVRLVEPEARKHNVRVEVTDRAAVSAQGSFDTLTQVLLNLVLNAIDASPAGAVVRVASRRVDEGVELRVDDEGSGIDDAHRDRVFEPFFTTKAVGQGTGLGLAVCHSLVARMGGALRFERREPVGTSFVVRLVG